MRETNPSKQSKFTDQNQIVRANPKSNNTKLKSSSSWGSHIVKGFSLEKKAKQQTDTNTATTKKLPLSRSNHKNPFLPYHSRVKRSLLGEFPCSAGTNAAQVYPQYSFDSSSYRTKLSSASSRDLFLELDHLRGLLRDSKEREIGLRAELLEYKTTNPKVSDLGSELELKRNETDALVQRVSLLEAEKISISEQLSALSSIIERQEESSHTNLEMEIVELRRLNKELQLQKRNLACRLSAAESQLAALEKISQSEIVAKVEAEASLLRHKNENLCKQVEGLQMSRFTEVEELVYLRWVNSCLRNELRNLGSTIDQDNDKGSSPNSILSLDFSGGKKLNLMKKLNKWPKIEEDLDLLPNLECPHGLLDKEERRSPSRRHSISGTKYCAEELVPSKRRQSDGFICSKGVENEGDTTLVAAQNPQCFANRQETNKINMASLDIEKRALRIPNPPPRPSSGLVSSVHKEDGLLSIPPPPPPPPPPLPPLKFSIKSSTSTVQRAPQVVEFYHSLMKRDSRKDSSAGGICDNPNVANVRSSMIDEIENRSSHLLAIKADVETQGEFVNSLIREVNDAEYQDIEDVVAFVKWLDDELCFLVDERAVLKHFDWPEKKADTLREAAFEYRDLKKLESEVSYYEDDPRLPCDTALKKMVALSEKMERSVYNLLKKRDMLMRHSKEFQIPIDWMLDTGIISKIKFGSVKLAKKYMKRVAMELQFKKASEKDPALEYMLLQGVRFAFRIHQFAGGFDAETMHAFEELRNLAYVRHKK